MKITKAFTALIVALASIIISSCDNDPHDPDIILSGDISDLIPQNSARLSCSISISNKYISLTAEPIIYLDLDKWGLYIEKVDYYIDDMFYESKTVSPYTLHYESKNWNIGTHSLRADIYIVGKDIEPVILQCIKDFG